MPQLCWNDNQDPDGDPVQFWVDVWTTDGRGEQSGWIAQLCWQPPTLQGAATYYWHVSAQDPTGVGSGYSTDWQFTIVKPAATPTAIRPKPTAVPPTATPTPVVLLPAPVITQPGNDQHFGRNAIVTVCWEWPYPLGRNDWFVVGGWTHTQSHTRELCTGIRVREYGGYDSFSTVIVYVASFTSDPGLGGTEISRVSSESRDVRIYWD